MLQRGRARAGAECDPIEIKTPGARPGFNGAAPARARNAEVRQPAPKRRSRSFNGAAPARARNVEILRRSDFIPKWLQRGRARAGAECRMVELAFLFAIFASTGPRPRGRGMPMPMPMPIPPRHMLQRGRARAGAEWRPDGYKPRSARRASTGPRPRGRGMPDNKPRSTFANPCFNGAAPARARNVWPVLVIWATPDWLQRGPRPRGRGMCAWAHQQGTVPASFNGAAPARARNGRWAKAKAGAKCRLLQRGRARAGPE